MTRLVDDIKSGLKGIRGAGDAIRGEAMEATDQAFEKNPSESAASQTKNHALAQQGKADMRGADDTLARREWEKEGTLPPHNVGAGAGSAAAAQAQRPPLKTGDTALEGSHEIAKVPSGRLRELNVGLEDQVRPR